MASSVNSYSGTSCFCELLQHPASFPVMEPVTTHSCLYELESQQAHCDAFPICAFLHIGPSARNVSSLGFYTATRLPL